MVVVMEEWEKGNGNGKGKGRGGEEEGSRSMRFRAWKMSRRSGPVIAPMSIRSVLVRIFQRLSIMND